MSKATEKAAMKAEAVRDLAKMGVKPGVTLYTSVSHVSRSGMSRRISVYMVKKGEIVNITGYVAHALDYRRHDDGGLVVGGCGMDMGFAVVYNLGRTMFPNGGPLEVAPYSRQMQAKRAKETTEKDGGYLLKQSWL